MKTNLRKYVLCHFAVLLLGLMLLLIPAGIVSAAGGKQQLSRKRLTLNFHAGATVTLEGANRNVRWSVSGKKLITVLKRGKWHRKAKIRAGKTAGTCYLVAKSGKKTWKCKVTVRDPKAFRGKPLSKETKKISAPYKAGDARFRKPDKVFVRAVSDTSLRLLKEIVAKETGEDNILISPDSVLTALAMVETGAAGKTRSEMADAMGGISAGKFRQYLASFHDTLTNASGTDYRIANSVWFRNDGKGLKEKFLQNTVTYFGAEIFAAPFDAKTLRDMNRWVYNRTRGKIPQILDRLDPEMRAVVMNAVYFKGDWMEPYEDTVSRKFTDKNGKETKTQMLEGIESVYLQVGKGTGFVKPYQGGKIGFLGILPPKGTSAEAYLKSLTGKDLTDAWKKRKTSGVKVRTRMPVFKYEYNVSLANILKKMGIRSAFTDNADFSRMSKEGIHIDDVLHRTYIDVNKTGTEAAAVTAVVMKANSAPGPKPQIKEVYLDRPFVYGLVDMDTGIPLFLGIVRTVG